VAAKVCEFKVFMEGDQVAEDVIYARQEKGKVVLRDIVGKLQTFDGVEIIEVDVLSTSLLLRRSSSGD
jgi:predicted RNA-binding protein